MAKTFLFVPGAWMGKWIWKDLEHNLEKLNHKVYSITLSGLSSAYENKNFGLQDHVNNVKELIENENLHDLILVGHSYSGFVIGQVADQISSKISKLIFVEAFLPTNDENLFEGAGLDPKEENKAIETNNGNWPPPTLDELRQQSYMTSEHVEYLSNNLIHHPAKSVQEKTKIESDNIKIQSTFVGGKLNLSDEQKKLYGKVKFYKLNGGHWPMLSKLEKLTDVLDKIATVE